MCLLLVKFENDDEAGKEDHKVLHSLVLKNIDIYPLQNMDVDDGLSFLGLFED